MISECERGDESVFTVMTTYTSWKEQRGVEDIREEGLRVKTVGFVSDSQRCASPFFDVTYSLIHCPRFGSCFYWSVSTKASNSSMFFS